MFKRWKNPNKIRKINIEKALKFSAYRFIWYSGAGEPHMVTIKYVAYPKE